MKDFVDLQGFADNIFAQFHKILYYCIMKYTTIQCSNCGNSFNKPLNEYNRRLKDEKLVFYCSRRCSAIKNINNFGDKRNTTPPKSLPQNPFNYYLRNIKKRTHDVDIDLDYLKQLWEKQEGICPYSKIKMELNTHSHRHENKKNIASLDRIDSSLGYIKGNVQFIILPLNYMKNTMNEKDFLDLLKEIANNIS